MPASRVDPTASRLAMSRPATGEKGAPTPDYTEFETFKLVRPRSR
jgi:hypothetical protein